LSRGNVVRKSRKLRAELEGRRAKVRREAEMGRWRDAAAAAVPFGHLY